MTLATVEPDGRPSARMVICRGFDPQAGWFVFYTDRESAKGQALAPPPAPALGRLPSLGRARRVVGGTARARPRPRALDADARARVGRVPRRRLARDAPPAVSSPALASRYLVYRLEPPAGAAHTR